MMVIWYIMKRIMHSVQLHDTIVTQNIIHNICDCSVNYNKLVGCTQLQPESKYMRFQYAGVKSIDLWMN